MTRKPKKIALCAATLLACLPAAGCRSAFVQTSIVNQTGAPVRLIEVDYPSASFGTQQIDKGTTFNYRFKVLGSGAVTISFTGGDNKIHTSTGPTLDQGQQGTLIVTLGSGDSVTWNPHLSAPK
ncbi:MAG TPA: hypothetical protein VFW25_05915 [Silvibacterium sp.]|nr:hypothetical protein [Silvibacterium sp.]